jgi:LPS export ABC transporter protein LptC
MKKESANWRIGFEGIGILLLMLFLSSCNKKIDKIKKIEILTLPSLTVRNDTTVFDDSGKVQLIMSFRLMETYDNADIPYSEFPEGINVVFYDGQKDPVGSVTSHYARYINKKSLWELKDSVVVINQTNDKLETEQLFWDQSKDNIYTDRFVKMTNDEQIVMGTGFESDTHLNRRRIKNPSGTIYVSHE